MKDVVQVLVELDPRGQWPAHSLELLSDARALAPRLGGAVGGWLLTSPSAARPDPTPLAACGCRRLRQLRHERFATWSSEAIAVALATRLPAGTRLVLCPGTPRGEEVAALLAARLDSPWIPDAVTFSATRSGALEISAILENGKLSRGFRPAGESPIVATMRPGVADIRSGPPEAIEIEEETADLTGDAALTWVDGFVEADPKTVDIVLAERIVAAGRGTGGPEGVALVSALADALHASLGASRMAVDLGWAPPARQVGQTGRTVSPELYVACGISGASHHLIGMRQSKHIIAINPDPKAPIHDVAHLSLKGDLHELIPLIIAELKGRARPPGGPVGLGSPVKPGAPGGRALPPSPPA